MTVSSDSMTVRDGQVVAYTGPGAVDLFRVRCLKMSISLYAKTGMIPTRGVTITKMLTMATQYTGQKYKRGQYDRALADLDVVISDKAVLIPVTEA